MTINEKISALRTSMKKHGVNALVIPGTDPHISESPCAKKWIQRTYFSGFTGSAGTLVVTDKESGLWTDGRYFVQAEKQLNGSEIKLFKMRVKGVPTITEYLESTLNKGEALGIYGETTSADIYEDFAAAAERKGFDIKSVPCIEECWEDRPVLSKNKLFVHDIKYTGLTAKEKVNVLREKLAEKNADSIVITALHSIIWLLNIRNDINYGSLAFPAFCFVSKEDVILFADCEKLDESVEKHFNENGIVLKNYDDIISFIKGYSKKSTFLLDKMYTNFEIYNAIKENANLNIVFGEDPILMLKSVKSAHELKNIDNAHIKDGCALVKFQMKLEEMLNNNETFTELDIVNLVKDIRSHQEGYISESFGAIAAYGSNAAMMHYSPTKESNAVIEKRGFLLLDNGGHYLDGSTDTTRTYAVGPLTDKEKEYYTLVLKSHVDMAKAWFLEGGTGGSVDIIAREPLWKNGLDYRCGTGHGVGFLGAIHEGPQSLRPFNNVVLIPGMTVTDEPGIYEENVVGVRTENGLVCVEKKDTEYGKFLGFDVLTYVPYDLTPIVPEILDREEIKWIDEYHQLVYSKLSPRLSEEEKVWLKKKTAPLMEQVK